MSDPAGGARVLRLGALGLAVLAALATGYELAAERHWRSAIQLIPWVALVVLAVAIALAFVAVRTGGRPVVLLARVLAGLVLAASAFGVFQHVAFNHATGALHESYSDSWAARGVLDQWLLAATKSVGPAPPLAPGALGQSALLVLLATVGAGRRPARAGAGVTPSRTSG